MIDESCSDFSRLRERAGLSIEALSEFAGYSPATLYRWERGEAGDALDVEIAFVGGVGEALEYEGLRGGSSREASALVSTEPSIFAALINRRGRVPRLA